MEEEKGMKEIMGILFLHSDQRGLGILQKVPELLIHITKRIVVFSFCTCGAEFQQCSFDGLHFCALAIAMLCCETQLMSQERVRFIEHRNEGYVA